MVEWLDSSKERLENDAKYKFRQAIRMQGEAVRLYAARLQKCFQVAYSKRSAETSKALHDKFLSTIPWRLKDRILTAESVRLSLNEEKLGWTKIIAMASQYDAQDLSKEKGEDECLWVNEGKILKNSCKCNCEGKKDVWEISTELQPREKVRSGKPDYNEGYNPRISRDRNVECFYCKREGHIKRDCRWLKNQCLVCGANDHRVGTCPNRRTGDFQRRNGEFTDRRLGRETNLGRDRALN